MESNRPFGIRGGWFDITETHTNNIDHYHANRHYQYCSCIFFLMFVHIFLSYWVILSHHNIPYCVMCSKRIVVRFL